MVIRDQGLVNWPRQATIYNIYRLSEVLCFFYKYDDAPSTVLSSSRCLGVVKMNDVLMVV